MTELGVSAGAAALPGALRRQRRLSTWLRIGADGTVTVRTGKVEIGQGITTALAQIVAEELDVDVGRISVAARNTVESPNEGTTSGSLSVEQSGSAFRQVCAEARAVLLGEAARRLEIAVGDLRVEDGEIVSADGVASVSYWELAAGDLLDVDATGAAEPKPVSAYRIVGRSHARLDLADKVAGRPCFIQDLTLPGQLFGRVVRPPSPGARLVAVDESAARSLCGVVEVVREGDFLGLVAERDDIALRAEARLRADALWDEEPTLPDEMALSAYLRSQPAETTMVAEHDDPDVAALVDRTTSATYSRPFLAHASIATGCGLARWHDDGVEVWSNSQGIYNLRDAIATALGVTQAAVVVHHVEGAGAYGHNSADDAAFDAVILARSTPGRPVRVQWSREDELSWSPFGSAMVVDLAAGLDRQGHIVRWHHEVWSHGHTSRPGYAGTPGLLAAAHLSGSTLPPAIDPPAARGGATRNAAPLYRFQEQRIVGHRLLTMPIRCSALRSLGAHLNVFAAESFIDELAVSAGQDPIAYRLAHLGDERARSVLEAAARRSGWQDALRDPNHGRGIAVARYKSAGGYCAVVAEVDAEHTVRVRRLTLAVDVGQVVNPDGVINQVEGGAIQATSWTVKERVRFDRTRITSTTWESYPILRFLEVPTVDVEILPRPTDPPLGAGEIAQGPTAAAIGNAVYDALGVRVRDLPLTPDRVVAAIEA
ncbi:MAG: molybdopterin cofactor-binding domain-containing protein [Acidimicrobiales bacterium]